ncbi:GNAT family N-acetyltransferase [Actinoplanes sp. NPDC051851]|uniref:GNAT family N-acetyltransferase n=1 Tax=Actinoplanes sp. NPDC051851 TaxID=3154753 RepID=UPI003440FA16
MIKDVDAAAEAWLAAIALLASTRDGATVRRGERGTTVLTTDSPFAFVNGVISTRHPADAAEVASAARSISTDAAWAVQVRGDEVDDLIERTARERGLTARRQLPFMIKDLTESEPGAPRYTLRGPDESGRFQRAMADGFGGTLDTYDLFASAATLNLPGVRAVTVEEPGGGIVATALGVLVHDMVGVFGVAVPAAHRRRGHGRAVTAALLAAARSAGARTAFLHASDDGLPVYRDLGFTLVEKWTMLYRPR